MEGAEARNSENTAAGGLESQIMGGAIGAEDSGRGYEEARQGAER